MVVDGCASFRLSTKLIKKKEKKSENGPKSILGMKISKESILKEMPVA